MSIRAFGPVACVPAALLLTLVASRSVAQDDVPPSPYLLCAGCHGPQGEGNADLKAPPLAGQSATYVARQLAKFRGGQRAYVEADQAGQVMKGIAQTLQNDEAMLKVAEFVSKMPRVQASPTATLVDSRSDGRTIFAACAGCHGEHGEGNEVANAPNLAVLPDWYVQKSLQDFRSGARGAHPDDYEGRTMGVLVRLISDDQALQDLVRFIDAL